MVGNVLVGRMELEFWLCDWQPHGSVKLFNFSETEFLSQQRQGLGSMISQVHSRFEILFL